MSIFGAQWDTTGHNWSSIGKVLSIAQKHNSNFKSIIGSGLAFTLLKVFRILTKFPG